MIFNDFVDRIVKKSINMNLKLIKSHLALISIGIFLLFYDASAQSRIVKGKITEDGDLSGLPGVTISVKNTSTATQSDASGNYSISIASDNDILVFSFVGMDTQEHRVGNRSVLDVVMTSNQFALEDVVVVGYGTQKKKEITSAVTSIKATDFNPRGGSFAGRLNSR